MTAVNQETRVDCADVSPQPEIVFPPSDLDSDEPPLETDFHRLNQLKSEDFRGPDFFVVLGTERKPRKSWVVWEEDGKYPNVIIELLSDSTAATDRGLKKQIYQDIFRTPEYFWFDPVTLELRGFALVQGQA